MHVWCYVLPFLITDLTITMRANRVKKYLDTIRTRDENNVFGIMNINIGSLTLSAVRGVV